MVNPYLRCVDAQEAKAGAKRIDERSECGYSNARGGVVAR
jgi:hypothetical protein